MRELTLTDMERLGAFDEAEPTFQMTEEAFRPFYELTARPVRVYLGRLLGDVVSPTSCSRKRITASCARISRSRTTITGGGTSTASPPTWPAIIAAGRASKWPRARFQSRLEYVGAGL